MQKIRYSFLALSAFIAAGALIGAGCKQAGGEVNQPGNSGKTQPDNSGKTQQDNPQSGAVHVTRNFEGELDGLDEATSRPVRYKVTVSLSDKKVGATAQVLDKGYFFVGTSEYDPTSGSVSVTLSDAQKKLEAISLTANYEQATNTLVVTDFAGNSNKQLLSRVARSNEGGRYHAMIEKLPVIGQGYLTLTYNKRHAHAILVTGHAGVGGTLGSTRAYYGDGSVHRGKLSVPVKIDATYTFVVQADIDAKEALSNIKVRLEGTGDKYPSDEAGDPSAVAPIFTDAMFTLNTKQPEKAHNDAGNAQAKLVLRAEPLMRAPDGSVAVAPKITAEMRGYTLAGYRMSAHFIGFKADGRDAIESETARVDVLMSDTAHYTAASGEYTFAFDATAFKREDLYKEKLAFSIKGWRPQDIRDAKGNKVVYAANVVSGEYTIELENGSSEGKIPTSNSDGTAFNTLFGSGRVLKKSATGSLQQYVSLKDGADAADISVHTGKPVGASNGKKACYMFAPEEGFKQKNER